MESRDGRVEDFTYDENDEWDDKDNDNDNDSSEYDSDDSRKQPAITPNNDTNKNTGTQRKRQRTGRKNQYKPKDPNEMVWNDQLDPMNFYDDNPVVDFQMLSGRTWAKESVLNFLPVGQVDRLVGWATHVIHDGTKMDDDDDEEEEENKNRNEHVRPNPLIGIQPDSPLPLSMLHTMIRSKARGKFRKDTELMGRFDTSALVAMGMVLEEMMTANLLPLAECHVRRCRHLEEQEETITHRRQKEQQAQSQQRQQNKPPESEMKKPTHCQSFDEWTLPPEEAMHNLMTRHPVTTFGHGLLPTAVPPTRTLANADVTKQTNSSNNDRTREAASVQIQWNKSAKSQAALRWCKTQQLKSSHVQKNMDIYQWLLPITPPGDTTTNNDNNFNEDTLTRARSPHVSTLMEDTSAEAILKEHKLVPGSSNEQDETGALQTRTCSYHDCSETTHFICDNAACRAVITSSTQQEEEVQEQGLFFCEKHIVNHRQDVMLAEHKLVPNQERENKGRHRRRQCFYKGCKKMTHLVCDSPICRAHAFTSKQGETVHGLFLCKVHIESHHEQIQRHISIKSNSDGDTRTD